MIKEITVRKSDLNAKDNYDYSLLTKKEEHLLNCELKKEDEEVKFIFDLLNYKDCNYIKELEEIDKYRFLYNLLDLYSIYNIYNFDLNPANLVIDINLLPKLILRDIRIDNKNLEQSFITEFLCILGYILQDKFTYNDYKMSGIELLKKNKQLIKFLSFNNVLDLKEELYNIIINLEISNSNDFKIVNKLKWKTYKYSFIISTIVSVCLIFVLGYMFIIRLPRMNSIATANDNFAQLKYIEVIDQLKNVPLNKLSNSNRFIYATSIVKTENLSVKQKETILSTLSVTGDVNLLDYWIYLSSNDFSKSLELAKRLSNDELSLYSYMKEKDYLEKNKDLDGNEKKTRIDQLDVEIEKLSKKYQQEDVSK